MSRNSYFEISISFRVNVFSFLWSLSYPHVWRYSLTVSSRSFIVLPFMFRSTLYLELILCIMGVAVRFYFLLYSYLVALLPFTGNSVLFPLYCHLCHKLSDWICRSVCWLCSIGLFVLNQTCTNYYSFLSHLETW